jgi:hypothetical protein
MRNEERHWSRKSSVLSQRIVLSEGSWPLLCKSRAILITPSARSQECAQAVQAATDHPTEVAATLRQAGSSLRSSEYAAVIVDQFPLKAEPDESDQMLQHLGTAIPVYVSFAISGVERVVREIRTALARRQREEKVARQAAALALWSELKESVAAMVLSCDLALAVPGVPAPAVEKIRSMHELACQIRAHLAASE